MQLFPEGSRSESFDNSPGWSFLMKCNKCYYISFYPSMSALFYSFHSVIYDFHWSSGMWLQIQCDPMWSHAVKQWGYYLCMPCSQCNVSRRFCLTGDLATQANNCSVWCQGQTCCGSFTRDKLPSVWLKGPVKEQELAEKGNIFTVMPPLWDNSCCVLAVGTA